MKRLLSAAIAAALTLIVLAPRASLSGEHKIIPPFWSDLKPGPYQVGFRTLYRRDRNRKWFKTAEATDPGRPIMINVWYPGAPAKNAQPMTYGDYLHHQAPADFKEVIQNLDKNEHESWLADLREVAPPGDVLLEKVLTTPVAAYPGPPPASGKFPLLLYSSGKAARSDSNLELGEYLASHGYIVVTVPQLGPSDQELELGSSPQELALHADDFDSALSFLREIPEIDFAHIAAAGHSAGGEVAAELALRHPEIRAVIGLDASYGMASGARIFRQLAEYERGRTVNAALLDLRRADGAQGVKLDLSAIDSLHWATSFRVTYPNAYHGDFTEWGMLAYHLSIPMPANPYRHTRQVGYRVNISACHAVLDFLDAELRARGQVLKHLEADANHGSGKLTAVVSLQESPGRPPSSR